MQNSRFKIHLSAVLGVTMAGLLAACGPSGEAPKSSVSSEAPVVATDVPVVADTTPAETPPVALTAEEMVAKGKRLYLRCMACHSVTEAEGNKVGPHLEGIVGRHPAAVEGFNYSEDMKQQTFTWDAEHLDHWIENPRSVVPRTSMAFAGIKKKEDRDALIAYLGTL